VPTNGISKDLPSLSSKAKSEWSPVVEKELDTHLENPLMKTDVLKLYQNKDSYPAMMEMLTHSKKFFYMNFLAFSCDEATENFIKALEAKAKENVDVRLIINKGFSYLSGGCLRRLEEAGVKVAKSKTHSSYMLNEQKELMIGSQSIAKMFFLADGFNSLDRDMMIYGKGDITKRALKDFASLWLEENPTDQIMLSRVNESSKEHEESHSTTLCRFVAQRPAQGVRDIENLWEILTKANRHELFFSGVKVEIGEGTLGKLLKEKSNQGMSIHYLGNGYLGGDGELTIVFDEWIAQMKKGHFSFLAPVLEGVNNWDKRRVARENKKFYEDLTAQSKISVWTYFNFIHHKVWLFDRPAFFIGSANFDVSKFDKVADTGIYCQDEAIHDELKKQLLRDRRNSVLFKSEEVK
jgi:phosphatidylserine/phosphatidylglycerophosphate/cardiolipin synthase-like enzyme